MKKGGMFEVRHPLLKPLWRRVCLVLGCAFISIFDFLGGRLLWAVTFGVIGLYLAYMFFIAFDPAEYESEE